ncbi:MAG: helix-turn-helix domain-containing protein, partial [Bacteroidota bacterium]
NVRELQHAIERAIIMSEGPQLEVDDFSFRPLPQDQANPQMANLNLEEVEREVIDQALKKHRGNISKAAQELGLTRASLYRRMDKYGF